MKVSGDDDLGQQFTSDSCRRVRLFGKKMYYVENSVDPKVDERVMM